LQDYELDDVVGFTSFDVDSNLDEPENEILPVNPMLILPLPFPRVAKKVPNYPGKKTHAHKREHYPT